VISPRFRSPCRGWASMGFATARRRTQLIDSLIEGPPDESNGRHRRRQWGVIGPRRLRPTMRDSRIRFHARAVALEGRQTSAASEIEAPNGA